jgi:hypothetical protein
MIVRTACTVNGCPRGVMWALVRQVCSDRLAGRCGQRQHVFAPAIGLAKREGSGSPVDDVQAQVSDFSDAQTQVQ